jgi:hypothetical protein
LHEVFTVLARRHPEFQAVVCRHDDQLGLFGLAVKTAIDLGGS